MRVFPTGLPLEHSPPPTEGSAQPPRLGRGKVPDRPNADRLKRFGRAGTHAWNGGNQRIGEQLIKSARLDRGQPIRFVSRGRHFRLQSIGGNPSRCGQSAGPLYGLLDSAAFLKRNLHPPVERRVRQLDIRFIDGSRLHLGEEPVQNREHPKRFVNVFGRVDRYDNESRTKRKRLKQWHPGSHPVLPSRIRSRGDHTAKPWPAPHDHGLPGQTRVGAHLDRSKEGVHIYVANHGCHEANSFRRGKSHSAREPARLNRPFRTRKKSVGSTPVHTGLRVPLIRLVVQAQLCPSRARKDP